MSTEAQSAKNADVREDGPLWPGYALAAEGDIVNYGIEAQLHAALAAAQGEFPPIPRDRTVKVTMKTGGSYTFAYAPLDTILNCVRPALAANGLAVTQLLDGDGEHTVLRTRLLHAGGGMIESVWPISSRGTPQEFGSALTYLRRYTLVALLGIASEEDDDGNHASGNTAQEDTRTPRKPAATPAGTAAPPKAENGAQSAEHLKRQREAHAIHQRLTKAAIASGGADPDAAAKAADAFESQFRSALQSEYGTPHINELAPEQLARLVAQLRNAEKQVAK